MTDIRVAVLGARGRMGGEVCRAVEAAPDLALVARLDEGDQPAELVEAGAQVVVDFTHPGAVLDNIRFALDHGIAAVVGTSGFDEQRFDQVRGWLDDTPGQVLIAPKPGGTVTSATAALQTGYGPTRSEWTRTGSTLTLKVVVPPNTTAIVQVPAASAAAVTAPAEAVPQGSTSYSLPSGSYTFTALL